MMHRKGSWSVTWNFHAHQMSWSRLHVQCMYEHRNHVFLFYSWNLHSNWCVWVECKLWQHMPWLCASAFLVDCNSGGKLCACTPYSSIITCWEHSETGAISVIIMSAGSKFISLMLILKFSWLWEKNRSGLADIFHFSIYVWFSSNLFIYLVFLFVLFYLFFFCCRILEFRNYSSFFLISFSQDCRCK